MDYTFHCFSKLVTKEIEYDWVLENRDRLGLSEEARKKIVTKFDEKIIVRQYIELYSEVLNGSGRA